MYFLATVGRVPAELVALLGVNKISKQFVDALGGLVFRELFLCDCVLDFLLDLAPLARGGLSGHGPLALILVTRQRLLAGGLEVGLDPRTHT